MIKKHSVVKVVDALWTYALLIAVGFVFFFPCLWIVLASFSKSGSIYSFEGFFPVVSVASR